MTDTEPSAHDDAHPLQPPAAAAGGPGKASFDWIDSHTLLNALSVLRHRVRADHVGKLDALDAISAYYANGAYLQAHGSCGRLDYWVEWFTCSAEVAGLARSRELPCEVVPELADLDGVFELAVLGKTCANVIQHLTSLPEKACRLLTARPSDDGAVLLTVVANGHRLDADVAWPDGVQITVRSPDTVLLRVQLVEVPPA